MSSVNTAATHKQKNMDPIEVTREGNVWGVFDNNDFVNIYFASVHVCAISCYIGPPYNGTWLKPENLELFERSAHK